MDKIILEHSGEESYNKLAQKLKTLLEFEYDLDVEQMIGESGQKLVMYRQVKTPEGTDLFRIADMSSMPSKQALDIYINWS